MREEVTRNMLWPPLSWCYAMTCWITNRFWTTSTINTLERSEESRNVVMIWQTSWVNIQKRLGFMFCKFKDDPKLSSQREASLLQPTNIRVACCLLGPARRAALCKFLARNWQILPSCSWTRLVAVSALCPCSQAPDTGRYSNQMLLGTGSGNKKISIFMVNMMGFK